MHFIKNTIGILVATACLLVAAPAFGQTSDSPVNRVPVFVNDLQLLNNPVGVGGKVQGTFTLTNGGTTATPNVFYSVQLRGRQSAGGSPSILYAEKLFGPFFLEAGKTQKVNFEYDLPKGIAGKDLVVRIQAQLIAGEKLGWADQPINVQGTNSYVTVSKTTLVVGKTDFAPGSGPTVHKGETATYKVTFTNPQNQDIVVMPVVVTYDRTTAGTPLATTTPGSFTVKAHEKKELSIDLPLFDNKANVYVSKIVLMSPQSVPMSEILMARYIVDGPIATIHSITSDKQAVQKNDPINFTVSYTGRPLDIASGTTTAAENVTLKLTVVNEHNTIVGTSEDTVSVDANGGQKTISMKAAVNAGSLSVKGEMIKDGQVIDTYTTTLSPTASSTNAMGTAGNWAVPFLSFIAGLILASIILIVKHRRAKANVILPMIIFFFMASVLAYAVLHKDTTLAFNGDNNDPANATVTSSSQTPFIKFAPCTNCGSFDIFINTPNTHLQVGQPFTISGSWSFYACENTTPNPTIFVTMPNGSPIRFNINDSLEGHDGPADSTFSLSNSTFKFDTPGTYNVHMKFRSEIFDADPSNPTNVRYQILEGDLQITVDAATTNTNTNLQVVKVGEDYNIIGQTSSQAEPSFWKVAEFQEPVNGYVGEYESTNNPATFNNLSPTPTREIHAEVQSNTSGSFETAGYDLTYAKCVGANCIPSAASYQTLDWCSKPGNLGGTINYTCIAVLSNVSLTSNQTTRIFFRYVPKSKVKVLIYRILPDGTIMSPSTYPIRTTLSHISSESAALSPTDGTNYGNPRFYVNVPVANGTGQNPGILSAVILNNDLPNAGLNPADFDITYSSCQYDNTVTSDCTLPAYTAPTMETSPNPGAHTSQTNDGYFGCDERTGVENNSCEYKFFINSNITRKIYFKYLPKSTGSANVYRVNSSGQTTSLGGSATKSVYSGGGSSNGQEDNASNVKTASFVTDNPANYINLRTGQHTLTIQNDMSVSTGYTIKAATCTGAGCTPTASDYVALSCAQGPNAINPPQSPAYNCTYNYTMTGGEIRNVYIKYVQGTQTAISASCTVNPTSITTGQSATWAAANVSGGTPPYTYSWGGGVGGTDQSETIAYPTAGTYNATLIVNSADGNPTSTITCPTLTVSSAPPPASIACKPTNPADGATLLAAPVGKPVKWVATAADGSAAPGNDADYTWTGSVSGTGKTVTRSYTTTGVKMTSVTYNGSTVQCSVTNFKVSNDPNYIEF